MKNIFILWLEGVKILLPFLGLGIAMVLATYLMIFLADLLAIITGCSKNLEIIQFFLPKKVYNKLNSWFKE